MAQFTTTPVSLIPPMQQSAGSAKPQAADLAASSRLVQDAAAARLFSQAGAGMLSLQQQVDEIYRVMRASIPQPASVAFTDPNGNLIAWIGFNVINGIVYEGGWFKQFYIGGTNASNAVIVSDINGNVTITNATLRLTGTGGVILLDPTVPAITVSDNAGNQWAALESRLETPKSITSATNASPVVVTINTHGYVNGDTILVAGATGNTAINGYRIVQNKTANTFEMTTIAGAAVNGNGAYAGSATATRYYAGGLFQSIAVGPTWGTAKLRGYADGSLAITDALITLNGAAAIITLDPTTGEITVSSVADPLLYTLISADGILTTSPIKCLSSILVRGIDIPAAGVGMELHYDDVANIGYISSINRSTTTFKPLTISGDPILLNDGISANVGVGGSAAAYPLDVTGDTNTSGVYRKGGTAGESTTLTYVTGLSGVIPPGLGVTTKTVTFSGGIETSHT